MSSDRDRAREITTQWLKGNQVEALDLIAAVRASERERCAKVADRLTPMLACSNAEVAALSLGVSIAAAIRALPNEESPHG
jgi:hypothetical protein